MKLFLIERTDDCDYDEHDSAVIRAESEEEIISKLFGALNDEGMKQLNRYYIKSNTRTEEDNTEYLIMHGYNLYELYGFRREHVKITELEIDGEAGVVISSFNAG